MIRNSLNNAVLPFPALPSLLGTAVVLSFYGYDHQVECLLISLSKKCQRYYQKQKLEGFIIKEPRQLTYAINLCKSVSRNQNREYPGRKDLVDMQRQDVTKRVKLRGVRYGEAKGNLNSI